MSLFWAVFSAGILAVLLQAFFAWRDDFLTVDQMQVWHAERGVPFIAHTGMWGDLFLITPLMAGLVHTYYGLWSTAACLIALGAGLTLSFVMHLTYISAGKIHPEAHTHDGELTAAGWTHLFYMGFAFAVIALFFLATPHPPKGVVRVTCILLFVHVLLGVHVPLKVAMPSWFPYRGIWDAGTLAPIAGTLVALLALSYWALR